jgi:hypothetical protein
MGYFSAGFVFTSAPDWQRLRSLPVPLGMRGYAYRGGGPWLLDFWPRERGTPDQPFTGGGRGLRHLQQLPSLAFLSRLRQVQELLGEDGGFGHGWIRLASAISTALHLPTFLFAADDDLIDVGCSVQNVEVISVSITTGQSLLQVRDGQLMLTAFPIEEGGPDPASLDATLLKQLGITLTPPMDVSHGYPLYHNVLLEWPADAGDPEKLLGLGTGDHFLTFDEDFACVFERESAER